MNKKKLIITYALQAAALLTLLMILFVPLIKVMGHSVNVFETALDVGNWVDMEEYLFGIAGLISIICLPLLLISLEICKLSATGVIKNKILDLVLYIVNIVLTALVVGVNVNYFLGLGRTIGMTGLKLFQGTTWFDYATVYFYFHCVLTIGSLVAACFNKNSKEKK